MDNNENFPENMVELTREEALENFKIKKPIYLITLAKNRKDIENHEEFFGVDGNNSFAKNFG